MSPCNHEEADSRICIHVQHALQNGARNILVSTVDTDVIVILVGAYFSFLDTFPDMNIFVGFGTGKHFKINSICQSLGKEKSRALPFFHTFTGCDTTSQFLGKGKKIRLGVLDIISRGDQSISFCPRTSISAFATTVFSNGVIGKICMHFIR